MSESTRLKFWTFVQARHQAWAARQGIAPGTADDTIKRVRFTNMWRALDRGTLYAIETLFGRTGEAVWHTLMYRAVNKVESYRALLVGSVFHRFDGRAFLRAAKAWRLAGDVVFTGVYQSTRTFIGRALPGAGTPMDKRLAAYGEELAGRADTLAGALYMVGSLEHALEAVRAATTRTTLGPFAAHQAALDLQYAYRWPADWVHVGPGAKKGLRMIYDGPKVGTALDYLRELRDSQPTIMHAPLDARTGAPVPLALSDVEHALCEWQKYERAKAGGHAKGVYRPLGDAAWRPSAPVPPWWKVPVEADATVRA